MINSKMTANEAVGFEIYHFPHNHSRSRDDVYIWYVPCTWAGNNQFDENNKGRWGNLEARMIEIGNELINQKLNKL